jgi:predicted acyl esterase
MEAWGRFVRLPPAQRAEFLKSVLGVPQINYQNLTDAARLFGPTVYSRLFKYVRASVSELYAAFHAPALLLNGWYDWGINLTFSTWALMQQYSSDHVRKGSRMVISSYAHREPGYRDGTNTPALRDDHRDKKRLDVLLAWYGYWLKHERDALQELQPVSCFLTGAKWVAWNAFVATARI